MLFGLVAEPQQIQINVTILPQEPTFLMKASLVSDSGYVIGSINSNKDISVEDVEIYIKISIAEKALCICMSVRIKFTPSDTSVIKIIRISECFSYSISYSISLFHRYY